LDWDRYGPCRHSVACKLPWADINAFAIPASFTPGQTGRNILSGPGYVWHQITIAKQVPVSERVKGTLRVDFNNPFKYPFFSRPRRRAAEVDAERRHRALADGDGHDAAGRVDPQAGTLDPVGLPRLPAALYARHRRDAVERLRRRRRRPVPSRQPGPVAADLG